MGQQGLCRHPPAIPYPAITAFANKHPLHTQCFFFFPKLHNQTRTQHTKTSIFEKNHMPKAKRPDRKTIRAYCRKHFGPKWFVDKNLKSQHVKQAIQGLTAVAQPPPAPVLPPPVSVPAPALWRAYAAHEERDPDYDIYEDNRVRWVTCRRCDNSVPDSTTCGDFAYQDWCDNREGCNACIDCTGEELLGLKWCSICGEGVSAHCHCAKGCTKKVRPIALGVRQAV